MSEEFSSSTTTRAQRWLSRVERAGNRLPHPTMLFVYFCVLVVVLSALASWLGVTAVHPLSGETVVSKNLLSGAGLRWWLTNAVTNFTHFAPVGTVLVAIVGIGVAEHSGLLAAVLKAVVAKTQRSGLSFAVVLAGVLSNLAADAGYVVLIPLAALLFISAGRHPLLGIFAALAGVSGGYSANLLIGPLDAILAGISTESAKLVDPAYTVSAAGNYYFIFVSTFVVALLGTWVTEKLMAPRLGDYTPTESTAAVPDARAVVSHNRRALRVVGIFTVIYVGLILWCTVPADAVLRNPDTGDLLRSPFISSLVVLIAIYAAIAGCIFGQLSGRFRSSADIVEAMEKSMGTMAGYIVLMFFAAQFVNMFAWSQLGTILAINGAQVLEALNPNSSVLLMLFVLLAALINLVIGSASAKWALIAPIFVPMLLLAGISPEAVQMAYRIGDSSTNIITPLMPYFGVVIAFVQRYEPRAGIGTMVAAMLPYSLVLLLGWSCLLLLWIVFDLPLGPGAAIFVESVAG